jgi:hypothetical protein
MKRKLYRGLESYGETSYRVPMDIDLAPKSLERLLPSPLIQQTTFWGRLKASLGWQPRAYDLVAATDRGDVLVTVRALGESASLAYVPYGPEYAPDDDDRGSFLEELSERLRPQLPEDCLFIRWDLPWESPYANESVTATTRRGSGAGGPDPNIRELRMNFGTLRHALRKAGSDILPARHHDREPGGHRGGATRPYASQDRYNIGAGPEAWRQRARWGRRRPPGLGKPVRRNG